MASRLFARRQQPTKKATTLVSKQTLEQAVQEANVLVGQFVNANAHDERLDQLSEVISFLEGILKKSPMEMQQEGASTLDDYLDDAVMPQMAQKIKQDVDMIAKMKNSGTETQETAPVLASSIDFVSDRDEKGEPKAPELAEVPRLASKNDDLFYGTKKAAPVPVPTKAPAPAATPKPEADINQLSSDTLAKMQKALAGSDDLMNDKAAQAFIAAIAETLMERPVEVEQEKAPAAPAAGAPPAAAAPLPMAASFGGLVLVAAEPKVAVTPPGISEELMHKLKEEYPGDKEKAYATAWSIHNDKSAALRVLNAAAKAASGQGGSWFVNDGDTGDVKENGGRTPEIAEAHSKVEDNTSISRPATVLPSKFAAGDMTSGKALKLVERLGNELKGLYFEAKPVTEVLDSRPVREAVEAIYRAYDMMGEAAKVLNKQHMQEEAEEQATEVKEKNKGKKSSILAGLNFAAAEDDEEGYWKCANCEHEKDEHKDGKCTKCDCERWELDSPHKE
jgi:hypothetical protein